LLFVGLEELHEALWKPFAITRVIIDGRGCLVGKGRNFNAKKFKKRLDSLLLEAGAVAEQV